MSLFARYGVAKWRSLADQDIDVVAYLELRTVVTRIILEFDVAFAPGEDGSQILTQTRDHFTVGSGPRLWLETLADFGPRCR